MMKLRVAVVGLFLAVTGLGVSLPAHSMTCAVADPTLDEIVCGTFRTVAPLAGVLCTKYDMCLG